MAEVYENNILEEEYEEEEKESKEEANDFEGVISYTVGNSIRTINGMIEDRVIDLSPDFQRGFVWDIKKASKLIDSILNNLPIPSLLFGKYKKNEKFIVIDGQQRLQTIFSFVKGKFNDGNVIRDFRLSGLGKKTWNNKLFSELDEVSQRKILNTSLNTTILENIDHNPRIIFEIFNRLNTGGIPLTSQEVRNCIFSGNFNDNLKKINNLPSWRRAFGTSNPNKRMYDVELILRFYSLYDEKYQRYSSPMKEWLNNAMKLSVPDDDSFKEFEEVFDKTMKLILKEFGDDAFKGKGRVFNRSIFDAIMVSISEGISENKLKENLKQGYKDLMDDLGFQETLSHGTTDPRRIKLRIRLAKTYFFKK